MSDDNLDKLDMSYIMSEDFDKDCECYSNRMQEIISFGKNWVYWCMHWNFPKDEEGLFIVPEA